MERFHSTKTVEEYKEKSKNANTTKATCQWMRVFCQWAEKRGHPKNIETLAPDTLNNILQNFYAEINKKDGKDYEPSSLAAMQSSIDRYLRESSYEYSILNSRHFKGSRDVLEGKARMLREKGMGKKPNKTNSLTREEEEILWQSGQLGDETPKSIIRTLWWQLTQHFGLRGRQEHHSMRVEDFKFRRDESGTTYIMFSEGITKTRQSGLHQKNRLQLPKMFATESDRCPVKLFRKYLSKRPVELKESGPFYLQPIVNPLTDVWYKKQPMGINSINGIMKDMISNSPLRNTEKHLANHSARKTVVKKTKTAASP